jgi:hypothetical protein
MTQLWQMRTTIELPDELLARAKSEAALRKISLKEFFIEAIERRLAPENTKVRRHPPAIGHPKASPIGVLTSEQLDEAVFN